MATPPHAMLTLLAQQAATRIGFTVRRWWQEKAEPSVLRVEVERRLVGAPPAIGELRVPIPASSASSRPRPRTANRSQRAAPTRHCSRATAKKRKTVRGRKA